MSFWLKRVETFLESVDHSAAQQINQLKAEGESTPTKPQNSYTPSSSHSSSNTYNTSSTTPPIKSRSFTPPPTKSLADDDIFKFLNNDKEDTTATVQRLALPVAPKAVKVKKEKDPSKTHKKVPSITSSISPSITPPITPTITATPSTPTKIIPPTSLDFTPSPTSAFEPPKPQSPPKPTTTTEEPPKDEERTEEKQDKEEIKDMEAATWGDDSLDIPSPPPSPPRSQASDAAPVELNETESEKTIDQVDSPVIDKEGEPEVAEKKIEGEDETKAEKKPEQEIEQQEAKEMPEQEQTVTVEKHEEQATTTQQEEEEEEEDENDEEQAPGLSVEFVTKYNDMLTENAKMARENKLMRQEVVKLNEEINSLSNKCRGASEALSQVKDVLSEHQKMAHEKEKQLVKQMQTEHELETALHAKDMQISGMRAQYEQVEKTLKSREQTLVTYQERIEKLNQEKEALFDGNQRSAQNIQEKLDELEKFLMEEKRQHLETQRSAKEQEAELQSGMAEYTKALAITQRNLDEKTLEVQRNMTLLKEAQTEAKTVRQELVDYKLRATKVLQSKEKAIQEMSERMSEGSGGGAATTANLGELIRAQQERDALQQERDELERTVDQLRGDLQDLQAQVEADSEVFRTQLVTSEEALEKERKRVQALQIDLLTRSTESANAQTEADRSVTELKESLKAREADLTKLRKQIATKSQSSTSQMELENRLRSTTDHLLQKQAQIDTLLSEKSFLQLQLEHAIQKQAQMEYPLYKKLDMRERQPGYGSKSDQVPITIKSSDGMDDEREEPRLRQRSIASALVPTHTLTQQNFVSSKVVGAANFLDKMSASLGRILRQYPLARLGVILYIFMIHLMVFYILASWNPEVHADGLDTPPGAA